MKNKGLKEKVDTFDEIKIKKPTALRQKLEIYQTEKSINFIFEFANTFNPIKIIVFNSDNTIYFNIEKHESTYKCVISYDILLANFSDRINFKINGIHEIENEKIEKDIFLGKFKEYKYTYLKCAIYKGMQLYPYVTVKNNLAMLFCTADKELKLRRKPKITIDNIVYNEDSIALFGNIKTYSNRADVIYIILKGRKSRDKIIENIKSKVIRDKNGDFNYIFEKEIFFTNIVFKEDIYDVYIGFHFPGFIYTVEKRVNNIKYSIRKQVRVLKIIKNDITFINPYYTFKGKSLSLTIEKIDKDIYDSYQKSKQKNKSSQVWLIGEQPFKAQDTGFHFFKFMRENFPKKEVYYVIDFNSIEYNNVKNLGNVINYRSKEHFEVLSKITHLIASHNIYYLLPLTYLDFIKGIKAKKIFIQHGVFGTKNISNLYAKTVDNFDVDMFIVSSEKEKKFAIDDLHFKDYEVKITGLSRFDVLFDQQIAIKRQILIIPTWRDWLQTYDAFIVSEYYLKYKSLLQSPMLKNICKENNLELVFCLHPNMQKFVDQFNLEGITIVNQGEIDVQRLLKESILMITDYSSVGFDFSFLEKPVIYYQFDVKRFLGKLPSHLDINEDLPGDIVKNEKAILEKLQDYIKNDFKMTHENYLKSVEFIKYKDQNNNQRIKYEIENLKVKKYSPDKVIKSEWFQASVLWFRKSKYYFPIMKKIYILMKLLPLKERVVFESGLGTQYADAPRYIFEVLLKRYPNKQYIWIHNKKIYNLLDNCKIVKRLSWRYYYYLATSKYWVNNQNFPYYITKRKSCIYLQTWHGTPLKKMLFDLDKVYGRDEEYIDRVAQATNQWSYLLAQSPYAVDKFRSAFQYNGNILELGYPRNDILVNNKNNNVYIKKIKNNLNIPNDKNVILYAPTFRDNSEKSGQKFTMSLAMNFDKFVEQVPDNYILLLRLHVLVKKNIRLEERHKDRILDVSSYSDIQELYLISDILVTDYSSVFFDYANLKRPILFYAYDLKDYKDNIRGFYMDYNTELPGPIVESEEKLYDAITNIEDSIKAYKDSYDSFIKKYLPQDDGNATKRVVEKIFKFSEDN